jgi:hypothetical protein
MTQQTVKLTDCQNNMSSLEKSIRKFFLTVALGAFTLLASGFAFYYNQQAEKINKIAISSIKADERLEKRLDSSEERQRTLERQQAAMGAKIDANMRWLMETCSRIETKQTRIEEKLKQP